MPEFLREQLQAERVQPEREHRNRGGEQAEVLMKPGKSGAEHLHKRETEREQPGSAELLCVRGRVF